MDRVDVKQYLADIPCIHYGGCLVSAYAFQQWHKNQGLDMPKLVALHYSGDAENCRTNREFISNNGGEAGSASHFGWTFDDKEFFDCEEEIDLCDYATAIIIPLDLSAHFYKSAMIFGGWNPCFDRGYIRNIQEKLKVDLDYGGQIPDAPE